MIATSNILVLRVFQTNQLENTSVRLTKFEWHTTHDLSELDQQHTLPQDYVHYSYFTYCQEEPSQKSEVLVLGFSMHDSN